MADTLFARRTTTDSLDSVHKVPFDTVVSQTGTALSVVNDANGDPTSFVHGPGPWLFSYSVLIDPDGVSAKVGDHVFFETGPSQSATPVNQTNGWSSIKFMHVIQDVEPHWVNFSGVVNGYSDDRGGGPYTATTLFVDHVEGSSGTGHVYIGSAHCQVAAVSPTEGAIVGRNLRTSNSPTFQGTAVRILSARAPVVDGRSYAVVLDGEVEMTSTGAATTQHELRYTTNDVEPTTSDTQLSRIVTYQDPAGTPVGVHDEAYFHATGGGFLRVAVCSHRPVGTTTGQWTAASDRPMTLSIIDAGPTVATDGTVY